MTGRCWTKPTPLVVVFQRTGEQPVRIEVADGEKAVLIAVKELLMRGQLRAGDRLTVEAAG
jgi:hypothetical protein